MKQQITTAAQKTFRITLAALVGAALIELDLQP
jgi:hypothetical protein